MTYNTIYVPPKKTTRWWHILRQQMSTSKSIAKFFAQSDAYFYTYASIFRRIGRMIGQGGKNCEYYKVLHDILTDFMIDDIRQTYGQSVSDIVTKYVYYYYRKENDYAKRNELGTV